VSVSDVNSRKILSRKDSRWADPLQCNQHQTNTVQWYLSFSFRSSVSKRDSGRLQGLSNMDQGADSGNIRTL